jgi:hypothetical protein
MENQEEIKEKQKTDNNETKTDSNEQNKGAGNFVKWAIVILVIAIVIIFATLKLSENQEDDGSLLATVGDTKITMEDIQPELEQIKAQYLNQGVDISNEEGLEDTIILQILENHINKVVLLKYAEELNLKIEDDEVEEEYQKILTQFGGKEGLETAMQESQITEENLREDIRNSLIFQLIAEQESNIEITEEEVQNRYQELKEQLGDGLPPISEISDQLEQEMINEKMGVALESIIMEVKEKYNVEIFHETQPVLPADQTQTTPQEEEITEEELMEIINEQEQKTEE